MNQDITKKIAAGVSGKYTITENKTKKVIAETDNYITDWGMMRMAGHPWTVGGTVPNGIKAPIGALVENLRYLFLGTKNTNGPLGKPLEMWDLAARLNDFSGWKLNVPWGGWTASPQNRPIGSSTEPAGKTPNGMYDGVKGETTYSRDPVTNKLIVTFRKDFDFEITSPTALIIKEIGIGPRRPEFDAAEWPIEAYGGNPLFTSTDWQAGPWRNPYTPPSPGNNNSVAGSITRPAVGGGPGITVQLDGFPYGYQRSGGRFNMITVGTGRITVGPEDKYKLIAGIFSRSTFPNPGVTLNPGSSYTFTYELKITLNCTEFEKDNSFTPDVGTLPAGTLPAFSESVRSIRYKPFFELTTAGVPEDYYFGVEPFVPPFLENGSVNPGYPAVNPGGTWMVDLYNSYLSINDYNSLAPTLTSLPTHIATTFPGDLYNNKYVKITPQPRDTNGELIGAFHHFRITTPADGVPGTAYNPNYATSYILNKLYNPVQNPNPVDRTNTWTTKLDYVGKSSAMFETQVGDPVVGINFIKLWKSSDNGSSIATDNQTLHLENEKETGFITALSSAYSVSAPTGVSYWFKLNYEINYTRV